jgi:hypothetical protein
MPIDALLAVPLLLLIAVLAAVALRIRRRRRALAQRRKAAQQQRGATHFKELATAVLAYTGRSEITQVLLRQAVESLQQSLQLAPNDPDLTTALAEYQDLLTELQHNNRTPVPVMAPALDSEDALNRARMQLMEASRLLARAEKHRWIEADTLRDMNDTLKQTQRAMELRLHLRQAAQQGAAGESDADPSTRATPGSR